MKRSDFFSLIASILLCLLGSEFFLRIAKLGYNNAPLNPSNISHHEHPRNFSFTAYSPVGEWDDFLVKTNEYGDRIVGSCNKEMQSGQIILLGDSGVEGFQVKDSDTIAGKLQSLYCDEGLKVSNLGVSAYSPFLSYVQICHRLKNNDLVLEKSKVNRIVHILSDNYPLTDYDYKNSLSSSMPCPIVSTNNKLSILQIVSRHSYLARYLQRFRLTLEVLIKKDRNVGSDISSNKKFTPSDKCNQRDDQLIKTSKYIKKIKDLSTYYDADYFLSAIPSDSRKNKSTNYSCTLKIAKLSGVKFISAPLELFDNPQSYYFEKDIHLNSAGTVFFAESLFEQINSSNTLFLGN
tara:strand:- start:1964 stop:3010 length:1047 start_codon:yes stop_codon:yes gene_type:complete